MKKETLGFLSKTICIIPLELTFAFLKIFGKSHLGIRKLKIERIKTYVRFMYYNLTRYVGETFENLCEIAVCNQNTEFL